MAWSVRKCSTKNENERKVIRTRSDDSSDSKVRNDNVPEISSLEELVSGGSEVIHVTMLELTRSVHDEVHWESKDLMKDESTENDDGSVRDGFADGGVHLFLSLLSDPEGGESS